VYNLIVGSEVHTNNGESTVGLCDSNANRRNVSGPRTKKFDSNYVREIDKFLKKISNNLF
jgi:hypothetical protein